MGEKTDNVNHPAHYADHYPHEVIELTECLGFCLGNAVKYILRSPFKGKEVEDLQKAVWYLKRLMNSAADLRTEFLVDEDSYGDLEELSKTFATPVVTFLIDAAWDNDRDELASIIGDLELDIEDMQKEAKAKEEKTKADVRYVCSRLIFVERF